MRHPAKRGWAGPAGSSYQRKNTYDAPTVIASLCFHTLRGCAGPRTDRPPVGVSSKYDSGYEIWYRWSVTSARSWNEPPGTQRTPPPKFNANVVPMLKPPTSSVLKSDAIPPPKLTTGTRWW